MTRFQKISISATVSGVILIPFFTWVVSYHSALASEQDLKQAIETVQSENRSNRRRDLLKDNKRDLTNARFKIYEIERHIDPANDSQAALLQGLKNDEGDLVTDQACIIQTGRECAEDLNQ